MDVTSTNAKFLDAMTIAMEEREGVSGWSERERLRKESWARRNAIIARLDQRDELLAAAKTVLRGLHERIDSAPGNAVPVFDGIVDLHDAISRAESTP